MLEAGKYFLNKQQRSIGVSEDELVRIAVKSMGLDELGPFDPQKKIIEYRMQEGEARRLVNMTVTRFAQETASELPAPGGGSVAAYCGVLGASLGTMVANLSSHKKGWDARWKEFSDYAAEGQTLIKEMLYLVDEDTNSFNAIMAAFGLAKGTDEEKAIRKAAIEAATIYAIKIPFRTMEVAFSAMELAIQMAAKGNPNSVSDAGVGALCARTAVKGCYLNVRINAQDLKEHPEVKSLLERAEEINAAADAKELEAMNIVLATIK
jgi:glutamate formiminotransferase/formiminotetrahydrofolate cyclodeaminase